MVSNEEFKNIVTAFLNRTGLSQTAFGIRAKNDPSFYSRIMSGQEVKESGKQQVLDFINNYEKGKNDDQADN